MNPYREPGKTASCFVKKKHTSGIGYFICKLDHTHIGDHKFVCDDLCFERCSCSDKDPLSRAVSYYNREIQKDILSGKIKITAPVDIRGPTGITGSYNIVGPTGITGLCNVTGPIGIAGGLDLVEIPGKTDK